MSNPRWPEDNLEHINNRIIDAAGIRYRLKKALLILLQDDKYTDEVLLSFQQFLSACKAERFDPLVLVNRLIKGVP